MYPPTQYARLPQDEEQAAPVLALSTKRVLCNPRVILATFVLAALAFLGGRLSWHQWNATFLPNDIFAFNVSSRPAYMDYPLKSPLVLRIAVVSQRDEFERRQVIRQSMFQGMQPVDLHFEYKFFIGEADPSSEDTGERNEKEMASHADIIILKDIVDTKNTLSVKRYHAVEWAGEAANDTYDYFLNLDSDTFCRFNVMSRALGHYFGHKNLKPREQPILIGQIGPHENYYQNIVPDDDKAAKIEDQVIRGPQYPYPVGIGYMLSSSLVSTILSAVPPLPHHIFYPSDDIMIGAWVAGMRYFPDLSKEFSTIKKTPIRPRPYFPQVIETEVLDNPTWHHFPMWSPKGARSRKIGWESVCIHKMGTEEMMALSVMAHW